MKIQITELSNLGDGRGFSFTAPAEGLDFVGRMADVHLASTKPGEVRGNHYHLRRREAIMVLPGTKWSLHWDEGEGSAAKMQDWPLPPNARVQESRLNGVAFGSSFSKEETISSCK